MSAPAFSIKNTGTAPVKNAYFKTGLPCKKGQWRATDNLQLFCAEGCIANNVCTPELLWSDGTIRWLLVEGVIDQLNPEEERSISISLTEKKPVVITSPISVMPSLISIECHNGKKITLSSERFFSLNIDRCSYSAELKSNGKTYTPVLKSHQYSVKNNSDNAVIADIFQQGQFTLENGSELTLHLILSVVLSSGDCHINVTVRNPAAATHPAGQWDLGDPNSLYINEIYLKGASTKGIKVSEHSVYLNVEDCSFTLHQASGGLAHWDSPVHMDASAEVQLPFKGYVLNVDEQPVTTGEQAQPIIKVENANTPQFIEIDDFWQNFPSSVKGNADYTMLSLLGSSEGPETELQPGEQKSRSLHITGQPYQQLQISLKNEYIEGTSALPFVPFNEVHAPLQQLIQHGINGDNSFIKKREEIDEFGWRHFGELYADHEKALAPELEYFVSHYNNQYDPINGFLSQWLCSGDERWFTLASDLASHVADIDVYHTDKDKPEYSGGLFWHTDHYVQAYTATHRTYSKRQPSDVYDDHAGGGGPGGQHCYTNGLYLHYLLTGNENSRDALLSIARWIENYYEGDGTLFGFLMALKNSGDVGLKNICTGRYPLDRGTGNYLQAIMDRYQLLNQPTDLKKCAHIIYNTISPDDDFSQRNFDNVEATWFYTVFLQAVCRYIQVKEESGQNDQAYAYAVRSLMHYAKWMKDHEYAYLDKPEILEFPNQTWTGQDLRKVCVLKFAKHYLPDNEALQAEQKCSELLAIIESRLISSKESKTTRVLCLMMQNANYHAYGKAAKPMILKTHYADEPELNTPSLFSVLIKTVKQFSLKRERQQAIKRIPALQKWLGKP